MSDKTKYSIKLEFDKVLDFDNDYGKKLVYFLRYSDFVNGSYNINSNKVCMALIRKDESLFWGKPIYVLDHDDYNNIITISIIMQKEYGRSFSGTLDGIKEHLQGKEFNLTNEDFQVVKEMLLDSPDKTLQCVFYNSRDFYWNYLAIKVTE